MSTLSFAHLRRVLTIAACVTSLAACSGDDVGDDGTTGSTGASATSGATSSATSDATSSSSDATSDASTDPTTDPTTDGTESASSTDDGPTSTGDATTGTGTTTEDPTTSTSDGTTGVAVSGLEAFCAHYVDCGGTYYEDEVACVDASLNYWGECPSRRDAQDAFGACMTEIPCEDWSPDSYNPANTVCAEEWAALGASEPC